MKCIFIMSDSFRQDHMGAYGNPWIHTPNLDRLAGRSSVFDNACIGSFPTGPNRRDIHVGKGHLSGHAFNPWTTIRGDEVTTAERLGRAGIHRFMITDVANGAMRGANMWKGFEAFRVNRGQEGDGHWSDENVNLEFDKPHKLIRYGKDLYHRVLVNRANRQVEDDCFAPGTFKMACEWLERNWKRDEFFLWVETFDPHEPWDPPEWYVDRYDPAYKGRVIDCPPYGDYKKIGLTAREVRHSQALYAGEVTMVDTAVGRLLATLEKLQLLDEVAIIFTSDHGLYCNHPGDAGLVGKPWFVGEKGAWLIAGERAMKKTTFLPLRTGTIRIPLLVKMPGQAKGKRIKRIAQPWDMAPTILDLFKQKIPDELQGESLLPVIRGKKCSPRPYAFSSYMVQKTQMDQASNSNWIYSCWPGGERRDNLIDLRRDPAQRINAAARHLEVCRKMRSALEKWDKGGFENPTGSNH